MHESKAVAVIKEGPEHPPLKYSFVTRYCLGFVSPMGGRVPVYGDIRFGLYQA